MVGKEYSFTPLKGQAWTATQLAFSEGSPPAFFRVPMALAALLLLAGGCTRPGDGPPPLPESATSFLEGAEVEASSSAPGLDYYRLKTLQGPWAVHLLRVDLTECELGLEVLEAPVSGGEGNGRSTVTDLLGGARAGLLAAVNGDFFTPEGMPVGTEVVGGKVRRIRSRPALAWRPGAGPWMGTPASEGDSLMVLGWTIPLGREEGETNVVGGFPLLLIDGNRVGDLEVADRPSFAAERHPRTAVGWDSETSLLWLVVVDGRQPGYSVGMSLPELTSLLEGLGIDHAINLDGGGSSVMVLGGTAVSKPSDAQGERPVVNAVAVRRDSALCTQRD